MASTTALWFHIETAFAEFEELCVQARAAELAVQRRKEEGRVTRTFGMRAYDDDQTQPIQDGRFPRAQDLAKDLAFREAHAKGADLVEMRERFRKRLLWLKPASPKRYLTTRSTTRSFHRRVLRRARSIRHLWRFDHV